MNVDQRQMHIGASDRFDRFLAVGSLSDTYSATRKCLADDPAKGRVVVGNQKIRNDRHGMITLGKAAIGAEAANVAACRTLLL